MAIQAEWRVGKETTPGSSNDAFGYLLQAGDLLGFAGNEAATEGVPLNQYQNATVALASNGTTVQAVANNVKFISETQCSVNDGANENLNGISEQECTLQFTWRDTTANTRLENLTAKWFSGTVSSQQSPQDATCKIAGIAPDGTSTGNWKTTSPGFANADSAIKAEHVMYLALSCAPTAYNDNTANSILIEFDAF